MKAEIEIDNYLTDEEKKEIAIDVFRERISKDLFKCNMSNIERDSEIQRIIGNISLNIVMEEVNRRIPNYEQMIKDSVKKCLEETIYAHYIFRRKDAWEREDSLGTIYLQEEIRANQQVIKNKIKEAIAEYNPESDISRKISEEFDNMSSSLNELADLFYNRSKK